MVRSPAQLTGSRPLYLYISRVLAKTDDQHNAVTLFYSNSTSCWNSVFSVDGVRVRAGVCSLVFSKRKDSDNTAFVYICCAMDFGKTLEVLIGRQRESKM